MNARDYWQNNRRLEHITPPGERFPEVELQEALTSLCAGSVFEFGCGDGRLAGYFAPESYCGMDINPAALQAAQKASPYHRFVSEWRDADTVLAYTVLLHVPDDEIEGIIERMQDYDRIVIGEIMGRKWRRKGVPPVFNREPEEYIDMVGREDPETVEVYYPRYGCSLTLLAFDR